MKRALIAIAAGLLIAAMAVGPAAQGANQASTRTVAVGDDFFSPKRLSVNAGTTVRWKWRSGASFHNVKAGKRPRGAGGFSSKTRDAPYSYSRKLSKRGTYSIVCTLHSNMTQKITVK